MTLGISQYAVILVLVLVVFYLIRWLVALRFQLRLGRLGFFSLTDISYHHGPWSLAIGKIKVRLKRPDYANSPTAWITIHLSDISISVDNIAHLRSTIRRRPTSRLNRRLSNMGDSLRRIPWWYSLSIVKHILKFTSALPAQLLMAGLANYVDVQLNDLAVEAKDVGMIRISNVNFSSVLFTALSRQLSTAMDTDSSSTDEPCLRVRRQRHSLKQAGHLFREKFFEITVQIGHVGLYDPRGANSMISLPLGTRIAIACHLSAGCVTLKDVHINMNVDAVRIKLDELPKLLAALPPAAPASLEPKKEKKPSAKARWIKAIGLSVSDTAFACETTRGFYTSARLHAVSVGVTADTTSALSPATYSLQCQVDQTTWSVFDNKPDLATDCIEPLSIPHIRVTATLTEAALVTKTHTRAIEAACEIEKPQILLDVTKLDLLRKALQARKEDAAKSDTPASFDMEAPRAMGCLPKLSMLVLLKLPTLDIMNGPDRHGQILCESLAVDISSSYSARQPPFLASPAASPPTSPSCDEDFVIDAEQWGVRKRKHAKPWTKIFRKSWREKPREDDQPPVWDYRAKLTLKTDGFTARNTAKQGIWQDAVLRTQEVECSFVTQMEMDKHSEEPDVVWSWTKQQNMGEINIKQPVLTPSEQSIIFWKDLMAALKTKRELDTTPKPRRSVNYALLKYLKLTANITKTSVVIEAMDQGIKGRPVPDMYLDNAPDKDIKARLTFMLGYISINFAGITAGKRTSLGGRPLSMGDDVNQHTPAEEDDRVGNIHAVLQQMSVHLSGHTDDNELLLWCSRINTNSGLSFSDQGATLYPAVVIKKVGVRYSLHNHYLLLVILRALQSKTTDHPNQHQQRAVRPKRITIPMAQLQLNRADVHIRLPRDTLLYARMDGWRAQFAQDQPPDLAIRNLAVLGVAPKDPQKWEQLIELDNITFQRKAERNHSMHMGKLLLRIPYGYVMADVIDNAVNLSKCIKALHPRLRDPEAFTLFGSAVKDEPVRVPHIQLCVDALRIQMDDDPFESQLRLIFRTGLTEQASRNQLEEAFSAKAHMVMQTPQSTLTEGARRGLDSDQTRRRFLSNLSTEAVDSSADSRVHDAWLGLQEHNANSWIRRIKSAVESETAAYGNAQEFDYRQAGYDDDHDEEGDDPLASAFHISTCSLPPHPPLGELAIMKTRLHISPPQFPLEETRAFVHKAGDTPLDTRFSTLVPFHLDWRAAETWAQIRDYPLALILVPPPPPGPEEYATSWHLTGDYVFGDELGGVDATRKINIPVLDTLYAIDVTRTSTPPKFYSVVNIEVHTPGLSSIGWSASLQPALQDISRVMDTLTRPPVDPSPKVGFWDKIRLLIHTRTKISFLAGDFAVVMKGTRDPYNMTERGFGLAKVWRNDVVWLMGHDNPEREFLQIISRDYAFGVPDLIHGGYCADYILPTTPQQRVGRTLKAETCQRFLKVALKLSDGIQMGIGCQLERACGIGCEKCKIMNTGALGNCRFLDFIPHYKVRYKTPQAVEGLQHYDAYEGFRSNFIHLSISIIKVSKSDKVDITHATMNSMHLSPNFIDHFVTWFRLFGGAMSYPMRNGTLFPRSDPRPTKKFGKHMSTMKYKVLIHPMVAGYVYKDDGAVDGESIHGSGDFVGLKAVVGAFNVDIHQRREMTSIESHKLDQKRLKANWPMHEAEVHLMNIDLRALRASFKDEESVPPSEPAVNISESSDTDPDLMEGLDRDRVQDTEPSDWIDVDDFVELYHGILSEPPPTVHVLPFVFSPCLYYIKQNNRAESEKYHYLRDTHECILGTAADTRQMQMQLLKERSENIDIQIRKHQARLHSVEMRLNAQNDKSLLEESRNIVEKTETLFEKRNLLQRYLRELSTQAMPTINNSIEAASYSSSTIFGRDSLTKWEETMGFFKQRWIVHNPQIIWNNAVRNVIYHFLDLQAYRRALSYYMSARAAKFLRDLTAEHRRQRQHSDNSVLVDDNEGAFDSAMAEDLIQKLLLSAQDPDQLEASNETESDREPSGKHFAGNVNDPEDQVKSIPQGYAMKSSYLIDLLHPQISLQSDQDPDSLVLMSNERMQVKGFNIIDINDTDVEMELVKNRTIVSVDNSQFFVAKKEQFDSVDLLLDNHYGAKQTDRWLAWIPPEMLINYVRQSDRFQRVAYRLASTMQYDKYNQLRFKANRSLFSQFHPLEDRCDSVDLKFPELSLTANASQYNAMYEVVTDLLLYKEPAKKERLGRLGDIVMAADRNRLPEAVGRILDLQDKVRMLVSRHDHYRQNLTRLDDKQMDDYRSLWATLQEYKDELYLGMEAIKTQGHQRRSSGESKVTLKFVFSAEKLMWEMLTDDATPLCEWNLVNTTYSLVSKEDRSSSNTLEVDLLQLKNTSPSPVFVDVLSPYYADKCPDFSRHKMLRGYLVTLAPVGGIPVVQHLEVNLSPLRLQMTYEFGRALASYFFPAERRQKQHDNKQQHQQHQHQQRSPSSSFSGEQPEGASVSSASMAPTTNTTLDVEDGRASRRGKNKKKKADDLSVMKKRASTNRAFILVKIPGAKHCLSYRGPKNKNFEDLRQFVFQQPNLQYRNQTWSWYELMSNIKKDFMRAAVLNNSTALLKEKLTIRRHTPAIQNPPTTVADTHTDYLSDSSDDDAVMDELEPDVVSLHSMNESTATNTTKLRGLSWRKKRQSMDENASAHTPSTTPTVATVDEEELTHKGRILFGKRYKRLV
ncbi:golgi-body localization protein domain-domain-containing protein [Syncephalastrum racemosum]|uniref:Golgi-body localization protein domain-domain-containing protein n=1 Tax=Syncephalastrum racemosum TaxID=13706 RepID=A0A1X2H2Y3_SYNRA|nr:golgi-body localization protein domain-domain-containing protein [Syncephalastrum racemosum]